MEPKLLQQFVKRFNAAGDDTFRRGKALSWAFQQVMERHKHRPRGMTAFGKHFHDVRVVLCRAVGLPV